MLITITLNGKKVTDDVAADTLLIDFVRGHGCLSVKRGCETANCGLCTVFKDEKPVLSCSVLAARASGHNITTLEGLQDEAAEFGAFIADQGAEQCGLCKRIAAEDRRRCADSAVRNAASCGGALRPCAAADPIPAERELTNHGRL